jgi:hypothetical protein
MSSRREIMLMFCSQHHVIASKHSFVNWFVLPVSKLTFNNDENHGHGTNTIYVNESVAAIMARRIKFTATIIKTLIWSSSSRLIMKLN